MAMGATAYGAGGGLPRPRRSCQVLRGERLARWAIVWCGILQCAVRFWAAEGQRDGGETGPKGATAPSWLIPFPSPSPVANDTAEAVQGSPPMLGRFHMLSSLACKVRHRVVADVNSGPSVLDCDKAEVVAHQTCGVPPQSIFAVQDVNYADSSAAVDCNSTSVGQPSTKQCEGNSARDPRSTVRYTALGGNDTWKGMLAHEAQVARLLTLQRNSLSGSVSRQMGVYEVLAVSRLTHGMCADRLCKNVFAIDSVRGQPWGFSSDKVYPPMVTYQNSDGKRSMVPERDADLLSLGRAVMVHPEWLGQQPAWGLYLNSVMTLSVSPGEKLDELPPGWRRGSSSRLVEMLSMRSSLDGARVRASLWLSAIAYVMCSPPARSFVRDPDWLCVGMKSSSGGVVPPATAPDVHERPDFLGRSATWSLTEPARNESDVHSTDDVGTQPRRPCWLTGLSSREINPDSPDEVALARRLGSIYVPFSRRSLPSSSRGVFAEPSVMPTTRLQDELKRFSHTYNLSVFHSVLPREPADDHSVLLSVFVVLPELVALIILLVTTWPWRPEDVCATFFVFVSGLVSMAGAVFLAVWESQGAKWRAAALRNELWMEGSLMEAPYTKRLETLLVIARTGYRPRLLQGIAIGVAVGYVGLSGAVTGAVWAMRRWRHGQPDGGLRGGDGGGDSDDGVFDNGGSLARTPSLSVNGISRRSRPIGPRVRRSLLRHLRRGGSAHPRSSLARFVGVPPAPTAAAVDAAAGAMESTVPGPPQHRAWGGGPPRDGVANGTPPAVGDPT